MKSVTLSGRNRKLTDNPHIYDRVTEYTDMVLIDDANAYLDFDFFFDVVTGDMTVNPKNNKSYEIPFEKAPKFCITSNYTLRKVDPSTEGRMLFFLTIIIRKQPTTIIGKPGASTMISGRIFSVITLMTNGMLILISSPNAANFICQSSKKNKSRYSPR